MLRGTITLETIEAVTISRRDGEFSISKPTITKVVRRTRSAIAARDKFLAQEKDFQGLLHALRLKRDEQRQMDANARRLTP